MSFAIENLSRENQLLILASRGVPDSSNEQLSELTQSLDWNRVVTLADRHGILPLLHQQLSRINVEIPAEIITLLEKRTRQISKLNLLLSAELTKLLDLFAANSIEAIPFKGPSLALLAYEDIGLRQFMDLDLLIHRHDFKRVRDLLASHGFRRVPALSIAHDSALLRFDCACNFENGRGLILDIHWELSDRWLGLRSQSEALWSNRQSLCIAQKTVQTFSSEDLLLMVCTHGFSHRWMRLAWICDVARLVDTQKEIDWRSVIQRATKTGTRRMLGLGLLLATEVLNARVPSEVFDAVCRDRVVRQFADNVQQQVFTDNAVPATALSELRATVKIRERTRDKVRSLLSFIATPRSYDWQFVSLHRSLTFLYYLIRPIRMAAQALAKSPHKVQPKAAPNRQALS